MVIDLLKTSFARTRKLHHAYGIAGPYEDLSVHIERFLQECLGVASVGNPDIQKFYTETLGIGEVRDIEAAAYRKALHPSGKFFIVGSSALTHEAQNALLKLLEDPPEQTVFFLIVRSHSLLLPTLRSRLYLLDAREGTAEHDLHLASRYVQSDPGERLVLVASMVEDKDRNKAIRFMHGVELVLWRQPESGDRRRALKAVALASRYLGDRSSSLKLLLEHLSVTLPVFKV